MFPTYQSYFVCIVPFGRYCILPRATVVGPLAMYPRPQGVSLTTRKWVRLGNLAEQGE